MKYLVLDFKNAGFYPKPLNSRSISKDFYCDITGRFKREFLEQYKNSVTYHQISGMLHVLFGERPKPSLRKTIHSDIPEIRELSKISYISITNPYQYKSKDGTERYITEKTRIKKAVWNSFDKKTLLYWERVKQYLHKKDIEYELFDEFINIIKELTKEKEIYKNPVNYYINLINEKYKDNNLIIEYREKLIKYGRTPFSRLLNYIDEKTESNCYTDICKNPGSLLTINGGVIDKTIINGKIIIPLENNKWLEKLDNGFGFATLLDGGFVTIEDIIPEYRFSEELLNGFIRVGDISLEKY